MVFYLFLLTRMLPVPVKKFALHLQFKCTRAFSFLVLFFVICTFLLIM